MRIKVIATCLGLTLLASGCATVAPQRTPQPAEQPSPAAITILPAAQVPWQQLNPARGDQSPQAANLWGDRHGPGATGFLVKFVDGFSSPPHIHNVSYRGVVIDQRVHNDEPSADELWMPAGSYWTQPKGQVHITSAQGGQTMAYIEIQEGPYLVRPVEQAFETEETPINVPAKEVAWVTVPSDSDANPVQIVRLWGGPAVGEATGTLVKVAQGQTAELQAQGTAFGAVVIQGRPAYVGGGGVESTVMDPGSYLGSTGASAQFSCAQTQPCVIYVRATDKLTVVPGAGAQPQP